MTPLCLVESILSDLPKDVWDPSKTFCDPSAGDGNFLIRVVAFKIYKGSTVKQALETTYGVEYMIDNVRHARQRVLINAFAAQSLKNNYDEVLPHLSHEDECNLSNVKGFKAFKKEYSAIVKRTIIWHDALTYHFNFDGTVTESKYEKQPEMKGAAPVVDINLERLKRSGIEV
jgi:hypothetical protein